MGKFKIGAAALLMGAALATANFSESTFNYGRMWHKDFKASTSFAGQGLTHLAIWLGDNATYNQYWEGYMVKAAKANNLTPVIYGYVIAEVGKEAYLDDCDAGNPNHCTGGANIVRNKWSEIISRYKSYSAGIAKDYGTANPTIWLIEPDFLQYSATGDQLNTDYAQSGGGIADATLCGTYFNEIVAAIKGSLPNAKIGVDISPWLNDGITAWYNNFDKNKIDYLFTSGGRTQGNSTFIRSDNNNTVTWAKASAAMGGKKIIADDGYGVGGTSNSDYLDWMDVNNVKARIADGVMGITIQEPASSFFTFAKDNANLSLGSGGTTVSSSSQTSSSSVASSSSIASSSSRASSSSVASSSSRASSSSVASSSSRTSSSSAATSSASSASSGTCIEFVNGTGGYKEHCYSSGLTDMAQGTCYTQTSSTDAATWIAGNATDTYWWAPVSCGTVANVKTGLDLPLFAQISGREFSLQTPRSGMARVQAFSLTGKQESTLFAGELSAGSHSFSLLGLKAGMYLVRVQSAAGNLSQTVFVRD